MRVLSRADVLSIMDTLTMEELMTPIKSSLVAFSSGACLCPARAVMSNDNFTSLHMPSQLEGVTCEKIVCVPKRGADGLPASILVLDSDQGQVRCMMNAFILTAVRTAVASLLATLLVRNNNPEWEPAFLHIFGTGEQAYQHARLHVGALESLRGITVVNRSDNPRYRNFLGRLWQLSRSTEHPARFTVQGLITGRDDVAGAVSQADIICCCTPSTEPLFSYASLESAARRRHINLIGSYTPCMREVDVETFMSADLVLADSRRDCMREAGDLMDAIEAGLNPERIYELGGVLELKEAGMSGTGSGLSIYKSVGMSVMDNAIARVVLTRAEALEVGSCIADY